MNIKTIAIGGAILLVGSLIGVAIAGYRYTTTPNA